MIALGPAQPDGGHHVTNHVPAAASGGARDACSLSDIAAAAATLHQVAHDKTQRIRRITGQGEDAGPQRPDREQPGG